jgi:hypothetical protein
MKDKSKPQSSAKKGEANTARPKHGQLTNIDAKSVKKAMGPKRTQKGT